MQSLNDYFKEILDLLAYEDYANLMKRMIDLTLDTEDIHFYKKMNSLLDWLEQNEKDIEGVKVHFKELLTELINVLKDKVVKNQDCLLEVIDLRKSYSHSAFSLGPISFNISEGEIIGLVGENGNGKTTLLRTLCGELAPTQGRVKYNFPCDGNYDLRTKLIYIPQRTKDWSGPLLDNLQFAASSYGILGEENEQLVDLIITRMGLRPYRNHTWKRLSSGYKMRFELARMLLRKPQLLLIDEPLANLDILAQQVVLDDFRYIAKSPFRPLCIVLSSQQLYEVEKTSDQVIFLKRGVPQSISFNNAEKQNAEKNEFIIEFESTCSQDVLRDLFSKNLGLISLQLKGGTYVAVFPETVTQIQFLQLIEENKIHLNYFRDISNSSRRFFL